MKTFKNPAVLLTLFLVIAAIFVYKNFYASSIIDDTSLLTSDVTSQGPGKNVLDLNNRLQSVNLDTSLFKQSSYQALTDFSTPLPLPVLGRSNPFDKI